MTFFIVLLKGEGGWGWAKASVFFFNVMQLTRFNDAPEVISHDTKVTSTFISSKSVSILLYLLQMKATHFY